MRTLDNIEIDSILKKSDLSNYGGTIMLNEVSKLKPNHCAIINLNTSNEPGSHWVCVFDGPSQEEVVYFDSFGVGPPKQIQKFMNKCAKKSGKKMVYSSMQLQTLNTSSCGWWCMYILTHLDKGYTYDDLLNEMNPNDTKINEHLLTLFYKGL